MYDFFKNNIGSLFSLGAFSAVLAAIYAFLKRSIFEIDLHTASHDSYAFVLDSERNRSIDKLRYYAQVKVSVDLFIGSALKFEEAHVVFKGLGHLRNVDLPPHNAPKNVIDFFGADLTERELEDTANGQRIVFRGVAESLDAAFPNLPAGGYQAFLVFVFHRFWIVVPLSLASFRDGTKSTISGRSFIKRRHSRSVDPIEIAKEYQPMDGKEMSLSRLKLCVLDFDFLPFISPIGSISIKQSKIE